VTIPIEESEFLTILGPSGAGKTTLLHMIAGFETPTKGEIYIDGEPVSDTPPNERDIGLVFQSHALFAHMTVKENISFPLKMRREDVDDIDQKVEDVLELVRLPTDYADKPVDDLSGATATCGVCPCHRLRVDPPPTRRAVEFAGQEAPRRDTG